MRRRLGFVMIGGDERRARVARQMRNLRVHDQGHARLFQSRERLHHRMRNHSFQVIRDQKRLRTGSESVDAIDDDALGRRGDVGVLLVIDACHLLVAIGDEPHFFRRGSAGVFDETIGIHAGCSQLLAQRRCRGIAPLAS